MPGKSWMTPELAKVPVLQGDNETCQDPSFRAGTRGYPARPSADRSFAVVTGAFERVAFWAHRRAEPHGQRFAVAQSPCRHNQQGASRWRWQAGAHRGELPAGEPIQPGPDILGQLL